MVLSLRNRRVHRIKSNGNLTVEKLSSPDTRQLVKNSEISAVILKEKRESHCRKTTRRQILADKTNNSDAENQVVGAKLKAVNSTLKSLSNTISPAKGISSVGSKEKKSPRNHNKELCLKKQNCIYSNQADKNETCKESEKYTIYEFEADENDPIEKKIKRLKGKKKVQLQKKLGCTIEEEIRAKNKMQHLKKLKTHRSTKRKAVKMPGSKNQDEKFGTHKKTEAKKANTSVEGKYQEGERENFGEKISHLGQKSLSGQETLATSLEQEQQNSVSECFTGLPVRMREMSPEFNMSQFGFITSTAEKDTDINRCTGKINNLPQSKNVLENTLQTPSGEKAMWPPVRNLNKKSKIPRELLSLFSPVRYDDISEEVDILSPIRAPDTTTKLQQTNSCTQKTRNQSVNMETATEIHSPFDNNLHKTISSNLGTNKPSECKQPEDFNIGNCFGFDEDSSPEKLNSAPSKKIKCVGEVSRPFRANFVIPRRPLYPKINHKCTLDMKDQKQDPNVSIFDLEEEEYAADTNVPDAGSSFAVTENKEDMLTEHSLSQESPKCYPVTKRLRSVRSKPIIEEAENDEEEEEEPTVKRHKKSKKTTAHDKELNKWATSFNSMCEEVDSFELCVE